MHVSASAVLLNTYIHGISVILKIVSFHLYARNVNVNGGSNLKKGKRSSGSPF